MSFLKTVFVISFSKSVILLQYGNKQIEELTAAESLGGVAAEISRGVNIKTDKPVQDPSHKITKF